MLRTLMLVAALTGAPALAGAPNARQMSHSADEGIRKTTLQFTWKGGGGGKDGLKARVLTSEIDSDKAIKREIQLIDLHKAMARAARKSAKAHPSVTLKATPSKSRVELQATGPRSSMKAAMRDAQDAMERRQAQWMTENQVFEIEPGGLSYDHARIAAARADAVAPVAAALREGTGSKRAFISRALRFSQSIPYQKGRRGQDTGFQRPLALLARNKGDCDGKSALFLALLKAELPNTPLAMVYVPGHALVGVGIKPERGDQTFRYKGETYVMAEPVGPAAFPLGTTARENRRAAKQGKVRVVPR
jgi:hypothetical protein